MTASEAKRTFGFTVRRARAHRQLGLRQFAKMVGVSPTYQSKIERTSSRHRPRTKWSRWRELLEQDRDELLALANRVAADVAEIIKAYPRELAPFLRSVSGLSPSEVAEMVALANTMRDLSSSEIAEMVALANTMRDLY